MKITIKIETEAENKAVESAMNRFCIENFQNKAEIKIEEK